MYCTIHSRQFVVLHNSFTSYLKCYCVSLSSCQFEPQGCFHHAAVQTQHTISINSTHQTPHSISINSTRETPHAISINSTRRAAAARVTCECNRSPSTAAPRRSAAPQDGQSPPGANKKGEEFASYQRRGTSITCRSMLAKASRLSRSVWAAQSAASARHTEARGWPWAAASCMKWKLWRPSNKDDLWDCYGMVDACRSLGFELFCLSWGCSRACAPEAWRNGTFTPRETVTCNAMTKMLRAGTVTARKRVLASQPTCSGSRRRRRHARSLPVNRVRTPGPARTWGVLQPNTSWETSRRLSTTTRTVACQP